MRKVRKTEKKGIKCKTKTTNMRVIITVTKQKMKFSSTVPKSTEIKLQQRAKALEQNR